MTSHTLTDLSTLPDANRFPSGLNATLLTGLAWEVYEYLVGMVFVDTGGYVEDTLADLAMDLLGAAPVALALSRPQVAPGRRARRGSS